ncbi:hypothetical protein D6850_14650 [Roseovarius spongiae]|uniref:KfrA N-terminal DNA-binding domain-containing protein n=1 Tax=Roseovarius spongiae TaxID=2320272 RepID=A0A3A8B899_9RHOB|nr:hypothetical protein [Roseovarius spongiae]RKF13524.1 hypothetical protein D6850_14650 [Roseovarius spongiae]
MTEKRTGRPPKYTEAQVLKGIELVEQAGGAPTGDTVKKTMCAQLGVPGGINAQSLDKEVERLLEERQHQRRERQVAALPEVSRAAVKEIGAMVETAVLHHLGQELEGLRTIAGKRVAAQNIDLSNQRVQIRDLLSKIDHLAEEIADLGHAKVEGEEQLTKAQAENAALKARIADLEKEQDFRSQMLAVMKETLEQRPEVAD